MLNGLVYDDDEKCELLNKRNGRYLIARGNRKNSSQYYIHV